MASKESTIYDVAKEAGVSPATVSRVLNEPSKVSQEKRDRIFAAIAKLDFVPKAEAQAVARRSLRKIGVIAPFFTQPSFMQRLRGISSVLAGKDYEIVVYSIEDMDSLNSYVDMITASRRIDGLVVLCLDLGEKNLAKLRKSSLPVCFVELNVDGFDCAVVDNMEAGRQAARWLFAKGCRNPAFIGESSTAEYSVNATELRLEGFREFFAEKGVDLKKENVWLGEFPEQKVDEGISRILGGERETLPDCVFASSDMIALRVRKAASASSGASGIPVVGFDDLDVAEYVNLTTVSQHLDESGRVAAEMILDRLREPDRMARKVQMETKVVERSF